MAKRRATIPEEAALLVPAVSAYLDRIRAEGTKRIALASAGRRNKRRPTPAARPSAAVASPAPTPIARPVVTAPVQEQPMKRSMSFAAFLKNVRNSTTKAGPVDPVFANSQSTPGSAVNQEGNGADGGYLVPPDSRTEIVSALLSEVSLLGYARRFFTKTNSLTMPADVGPYFGAAPTPNVDAEGQANKVTKGILAGREFRLGKLDILFPATDEAVEDGGQAFDTWLSEVVASRFIYRINDQVLNGNGTAGMPLGLLQSPALITQTKESGQTAGTIVWLNVAKLWSRLPAQNRSRAVWVAHPDAEVQLLTMSAPATAFGVPTLAYDDNGQPRLLGRPVVFTEAAPAVGSPGDIVLADMGSVLVGIRETADGSGIKKDLSIHCWFDYQVSAFRFSIRFGGMNVWSAPVTRKNGGNTVSSCAALEAR
jgi:HK97 family phage major capsid protein